MRKLWCWLLALSLLLCSCQAGTAPDALSPAPGAVPASESQTPAALSSSQTPAETESGAERFRPVCELAFPETDSFPMPFDGKLYGNEDGQILLSADEALYDYDAMWLLLEENFPYLGRIEAEMGIDWRAVRDDYRARLEQSAGSRGGCVTQRTFLSLISKCLDEFYPVGHLFLVYPENWRSWSDSWLTHDEASLHYALGTLMRNPRSEQFYAAWEELEGARATRLSPNAGVASEETVSPGLSFEILDGDIPFIQMDTFGGWTEKTYAALDEFLSSIKDKAHLIVDITGNTGGSTTPWASLVAALTGETLTCDMFLGAKAGALNLALNPQFTNPRFTDAHVYEDDSWREDFPYIQPEYVDGMDLLLKTTTQIGPNDTCNGFQGKVWLLVSGNCYSSSDQFAFFCKDTGFATLVGTPTGGNGMGAQPYVMALPYSGLVIEYEPYLSFNPDGTCNGISGTQPDIFSGNGQSALDACLAAIRAGG